MVMLAAASLSAQSLDVTSANSRQLNAQPKANIQREAPVLSAQANVPVVAPFAATMSNGARKAPASIANGAHYTPCNMLKSGLFYGEDDGRFGYNYNLPYLFGQAYWGVYTADKGSNWTIGTSNSDASDCIDAEGNFSVATAQMGVGGFYTPKIWSKDGKYSYFYGSDDADKPEYSVFFGSEGEEMEMCVYTVFADIKWYAGYSNTPAYGTREFTTEDGKHIQSDRVLMDYGYQKGLVVNKVRVLLGTAANVPDGPIAEGKEIDVYLSVVAEDGEETLYHGVLTSDNVFLSSNNWYIADVVFTEEDEDGFSAEVSPVCNGEVSLLMTGFMQEGVQCEIPMIYYSTSDYPTVSYYDQWVDGVQGVSEDGYVAYYADGTNEAMIHLVGYYNFLGELGTGETVFNCTAPVAGEGGYSWAVSAVQDGKEYNDFDLESTFAFDEWDFEFDEDVIAGFDVDSSYLEQYGCYLLYVAVKDLPAGVEGRTTTVKVTSGETATVTINITQGVAGENGIAGLKGEAVEPKQIYNLMGQKVLNANAAGLYIQNGKKTLVK